MARLRRISIDNPARSRGWKIVVISQGWEGSVLYLLIGWERERKKKKERFRKGIVESSDEKREANVTRWMEEGFQAKIKKDRGIASNGEWKANPYEI